jgi:hypothetical protein
LVLIVFSAYIAIFLRIDQKTKKLLPWVIIGGIALAYFYQITESSFWIIPFIVGSSIAIVVVSITRAHHKRVPIHNVIKRCCLLIIPPLMLIATTASICIVNNFYYGVSVTNERYQGAFFRAMSDLNRIDTGNQNQDVWISKASLEKAIEYSPTLSSIEPEVITRWEAWISACGTDEVPGDLGYWSLRESANQAGWYSNATMANSYWTSVAEELEASFTSGDLKQKTGIYITSATQPIPLNSFGKVISETLGTIKSLALNEVLSTDNLVVQTGSGDEGTLSAVTEILGSNVLKEDGTSTYIPPLPGLAIVIGNALKTPLLTITKLLSLMLIPGLIVLFILDIHEHNYRGLATALIIGGIFLSIFVLEFGTTWSVEFALPSNTQAVFYSYSGVFYPLWMLSECLVFSRLISYIVKLYRIKCTHHN